MQNAGIRALGLDWRYVACEVRPDDLDAALRGAAVMRFVGVNLTVPHKLIALGLVDQLDQSALKWGAVNTIRFEGRVGDGSWRPLSELDTSQVDEVRSHGFNTDADAIVRSLREDLGAGLRGCGAVVLGAGGAGRVAGLRLAAEGVGTLWLVNRTESKAHEIAAEIPRLFPRSPTRVVVGYPERSASVDLVVNATSAGLNPEDPLPFDPARFDLSRAGSAYDMIYRPAETPFLAMARAAGVRTANGLGMLLYQGAAALEIWSGRAAPVDAMRSALWEHMYGKPA